MLLRDLATLAGSVYREWVACMSGIIGVILWAAGAYAEPMSIPLRTSFFLGGLVAFFVASFSVWKAHHEAQPYSEAMFQAAQARVAALSDGEKAELERMAIEKGLMPGDVASVSRLEATGFVARDYTTGRLSLHGDYVQLVPRLIKEWRAGHLS